MPLAFHIDDSLVKQLLRVQFPQWSELPIQFIQSSGTDHAIYRLGDNMCVRLPRIASAAAPIARRGLLLVMQDKGSVRGDYMIARR